MANTFPVPRVSQHLLAIFRLNCVPSLAGCIFPFLSPGLSSQPASTAEVAAPTPLCHPGTCVSRSRCPTLGRDSRLQSGMGKVQLLPPPPLLPLPLGTADSHTLFGTYGSFAIPERDEQGAEAAGAARSGFPFVSPPLSGAGSVPWCPAPGAPTPQPRSPRSHPGLSASPFPGKAALPATWSCGSTGRPAAAAAATTAAAPRSLNAVAANCPFSDSPSFTEDVAAAQAGKNHFLTGRGWFPSQNTTESLSEALYTFTLQINTALQQQPELSCS